MKDSIIDYKKIGENIAKEALSNLPGGALIVPIVELIINLVSKDQLQAAIEWVQEAKRTAISGERPIKQQDIKHSLEELFNGTSAENSSYAFGYPRSFLLEDKLIQFKTETSEEHLVPREAKHYGEFAPIEKTETLIILIADKYIWSLSEGAFIGDEQNILVPSEDADITVITFERSKLSSPIVNFFERQRVTQNLGNDKPDTQLTDWDDIRKLMIEKIPSLQLDR